MMKEELWLIIGQRPLLKFLFLQYSRIWLFSQIYTDCNTIVVLSQTHKFGKSSIELSNVCTRIYSQQDFVDSKWSNYNLLTNLTLKETKHQRNQEHRLWCLTAKKRRYEMYAIHINRHCYHRSYRAPIFIQPVYCSR